LLPASITDAFVLGVSDVVYVLVGTEHSMERNCQRTRLHWLPDCQPSRIWTAHSWTSPCVARCFSGWCSVQFVEEQGRTGEGRLLCNPIPYLHHGP